MKKTFILHVDSLSILEEMTNEQKGVLFDAIYKYQLGKTVELDFAMKMAFSPFKNQFVRDEETYNGVVERNRLNGKNGGRPKKETQENPNNPVGLLKTQITQVNPKNLDSDNDSDNDSKKGIKEKNKKNVFLPPTSLEVENYFFENGYKREAGTKAYNYYSVANWQDSKGNKVKNWKQKMQAVWFKDEHKIMIIQSPRQPQVNYGRYHIE
jgi:hypothetical protein